MLITFMQRARGFGPQREASTEFGKGRCESTSLLATTAQRFLNNDIFAPKSEGFSYLLDCIACRPAASGYRFPQSKRLEEREVTQDRNSPMQQTKKVDARILV